MNLDDSFNDCDEIFGLYSSKKVTDTFKAQLRKIAANHRQKLTEPYSQVNNEDICSKDDKEKEVSPKKQEEEPFVDCIEVPDDDDLTVTSVKTKKVAEDSLEIVADLTPVRVTRQTTRLRRARAESPELSQVLSGQVNNSIQCRKRRKKGKTWTKEKPVEEITLEDSPQLTEIDEELNPELSVKVIWKSVNVKKFQIRKHQKLSYIFEQLSKEENVPEEKVILTFNNVRVSSNDTPDSLNLQVYHFLDGGVLSELSNLCQTPESHKSDFDSDSVTLKFQDVNKKIVKISLCKNDKIKVAMIKFSEQLEIPLSRIKFFLDGELLNSSETPATLGLEDDEVIDIKICD